MVLLSDKNKGEYIKRVHLTIHTCSAFSSADSRSYISFMKNRKRLYRMVLYAV